MPDTPLICAIPRSKCLSYSGKSLTRGLAKDMHSVGGSSKRRHDSRERDEAPVAKPKRPKAQVEQAIDKVPQYMKQVESYEKRGKWDQAAKLRLRIFHTHQRWFGDEHQETFNSMQGLSNAYMQQCRFDLAAPLQLQMLDFRRCLYGDDHPDTIESKHILACTYAKQWRLEEAKNLELEVLSAREQIFGPEHPKTRQATQILAVIQYKQGRKEQPRSPQPNRTGAFGQVRLEATPGTSRPTEIRIGRSRLDIELESLVQSGLAQIAHSPTCGTPINKEVHEQSGRIPMGSRDDSGVNSDPHRILDNSESANHQPCIGSNTSTRDGFKYLADHHCVDLTNQLDPLGYSQVPVAGSRYNDVWLGKLQGQGNLVALKCSRCYADQTNSAMKIIKRAIREAYLGTIAAKTGHPNIMAFLGVALFRGQLALVTPWMPNGTLMAYIIKHPDIDRWQLSRQVAEGLACIHGLGMVHGDLKAANVFVSEGGVAKIGDLGNAILSDASDFTATSNVGGGTSRWMLQAPELLLRSSNDNSAVDRSMAADIFALGITILEIITGRRPYSENESDPYVTLLVIRGVPPQRPSELSSETRFGDERWAMLNECWRMEPEARPAASEIRSRLKGHIDAYLDLTPPSIDYRNVWGAPGRTKTVEEQPDVSGAHARLAGVARVRVE